MTIRRIEKNEALLVTELFDKYRVFYKNQSDLALAKKFIEERLKNNESVIFVAVDDAKDKRIPIGFTQLYTKFSSGRAEKNWILNDLFVESGYRRRGIGEALIRRAMEFAKDDGAKFIELSTAVDNYTAQKLYESVGFNKLLPDEEFFTYRMDV